jgi:hypothetical protein
MSAYDEIRRRLTRREASFEPCLPRPAKEPPVGPEWIHEIKHDGFRILAWRTSHGVRLLTRNGYDFTDRFALSAHAIKALPARTCIVNCEAIVCNDDGLSALGQSSECVRCSEPGMPCPMCNEPAEGERPRMPRGFRPTIDRDEGPLN